MTYPYMEGYFYFDLEFWNKKLLRPTDQFPALCYAFGIYDVIDCNSVEDQLLFLNNSKTKNINSNFLINLNVSQLKTFCSS